MEGPKIRVSGGFQFTPGSSPGDFLGACGTLFGPLKLPGRSQGLPSLGWKGLKSRFRDFRGMIMREGGAAAHFFEVRNRCEF